MHSMTSVIAQFDSRMDLPTFGRVMNSPDTTNYLIIGSSPVKNLLLLKGIIYEAYIGKEYYISF